jgi:hypothetical protein
MFAVFFSHASGFVKQVQNGPPAGIKLINAIGTALFAAGASGITDSDAYPPDALALD